MSRRTEEGLRDELRVREDAAIEGSDEAGETSPGLQRRELLQAGFLGAAAAAVGAGKASAEQCAPQADCQPPESCDGYEPPCGPNKDPIPPLECQIQDLTGARETWNEPWTWRPSDWPGQQLDLNAVVNQNPGIEVGLGNPGSVFFSFGGNTPGPTIRMRGDETLSVKLRNLLGEDCAESFVGPFPDLGDLPGTKQKELVACPPERCPPGSPTAQDCGAEGTVNACDLKAPAASPCVQPAKPLSPLQERIIAKAKARGQKRFDFCLGEHANGLHSAHVTNMHTHGLHVRPDKNPDGTNSDNVILRVISQGDFKRRERAVMGEPGEQCQCGQPTGAPLCTTCGGVVEPAPICGTDTSPDGPDSACRFLRRPESIFFIRDDEIVGEADYEFRLGNVMGDPNQPHPPGTHWYHPHAHGATDIQVSSGMAGYLIIEGDVDDNINCRLTGTPHPDTSLKTGPWDYRERLMFMQRLFPTNIEGDPDSPQGNPNPGSSGYRARSKIKKRPAPALNGSEKAGVINMRPGAVERWRVINGSVDGRGYKRFMVLDGYYDVITTGFAPTVAQSPVPTAGVASTMLVRIADGKPQPVSQQEIEDAKCHLYQLSIDGVTLVREGKDEPEYFIKDLKYQFFDPEDPCKIPTSGEAPTHPLAECCTPRCASVANNPSARGLSAIENVFKSAANIRNTWVRPNEFYMGPANRTDVFFQLPPTAKCGDIFTVVAKAAKIHADTPVFSLQETVNCPNPSPGPSDIILAHIVVVDSDKVAGAESQSFDELMVDLNACLPPAPPYLHPITDAELEVTSKERQKSPACKDGGKYRTRVAYYSGWGNEGLPLVTTADGDPSKEAFEQFIAGKNKKIPNGPELKDLRYTEHDGVNVLLAPNTRTMSINGRKFDPNNPNRAQVLVNTCEEWALYNTSQTLWGYTDTSRHPQQGQYNGHYVSYPIDRKTGEDTFWTEENLGTETGIPDFRIVTRAIDHPFHIHQNPVWVMRIEIPDQNGNLVNILQQPRWMDSVWIPRNNGRIVFRSRFPDYVGVSVHHCHILQHEDNGMMTSFQLTPFAEFSNFDCRDAVAQGQNPCEQSAEAVDAIYPPPSLEDSYKINFTFLDPNLPPAKPGQEQIFVAQKNPEPGENQVIQVPNTGQNYPGFEVTPPKFEKERSSD